jgi:hypothetical protein
VLDWEPGRRPSGPQPSPRSERVALSAEMEAFSITSSRFAYSFAVVLSGVLVVSCSGQSIAPQSLDFVRTWERRVMTRQGMARPNCKR